MNYDDLTVAFGAVHREIFRLEVQQSYAGVPDSGWEAWKAGEGLMPPTPSAQEWHKGIAVRTAAGIRHHRVLVVDEPLNPYLPYEFAAFQRGCGAAGEQIMVARRAAHPDLAALTEDFWMVDEQFIAIMNYDEEHRPLGPTAPTRSVSAYVAQRDLALSHATPLDQWVNEHRELLTG